MPYRRADVAGPPTTEDLPGRLVLLVAAATEDGAIGAARLALADDPRYVFPRRVVTRPPTAGGYDLVADEAGFRAVAARGGFALSWSADDRLLGVPSAFVAALAGGRTVVVAVAPAVVAEARRRWPDVTAIPLPGPGRPARSVAALIAAAV